ncbi:MAG TPA: LacI family DNA-binding transcriptional regulator [Candidatus Sumerlaeota bacterium]|nr:LacI family DNA-binding transcriptional regulator [Candidatus Sumerlaeota bacterium]HOR29000.1 LacI family DNA-binding transcriptional regulator [Candidatus Sumerlaeota bacterium]
MAKAIGAKDIATMLGVSRSTVTRALNGDPVVNKETAAQVRSMAEKLGYRKNSLASGLVSGKTGMIGCIVPEIADPFYGEMVSLINAYMASRNMHMLLGIFNEDEESADLLIKRFIDYRVEGMVLHDTFSGFLKTKVAILENSGVPAVVMGDSSALGLDSVMGDDELGGYEIVSFLARNGYKRIAHIGGLAGTLQQRVVGYKRALLENNLRYLPEYLVNCRQPNRMHDVVSGLLSLAEPPDAIFCDNDIIAMEVMSALAFHGVQIPDQMGVVGFDNIAMSSQLAVPLTTVDLNVREIVNKALEFLMERIETQRAGGGLPIKPRNVKIPPRLCIRSTTKVLENSNVEETGAIAF